MEDDILALRSKKNKPVPFDFVLELLSKLGPVTRPMFGCTSVYVGEKIVLILREKNSPAHDDGIWVATTRDHHESLKTEFPILRDISIFGSGPTAWQNIPSEDPRFETTATRICDLILQRDPRIGKIPDRKQKKSGRRKPRARAKK